MATGFEQVELNYVVPQNFYMVIDKSPTIQYNLQQVTIPSITGGETELSNRLNPGRAFIPGNTLDYGTLDCTFIIDKYFNSYKEILSWLKGINHPDNFEQYSDRQDKFADTMSQLNIYGTDASGAPLAEWVLHNAFPTSIDGPAFDSTATEAEYLTATVSFRFTHFELVTYENGVRLQEKI